MVPSKTIPYNYIFKAMSEGTVLVQGKFSIYTQFLDRTFQVEVKMKEGESIRDAVLRVNKELEETAAELRKEAMPHMQPFMQDASYTPPPSTLTTSGQGGPLIIDMNIERLEIAIDNAQSIDDLKFFKEQNPIMPAKLIDHYNKRLKELTNGQ